jgi:serine/threonine protein kinase
MTPLPPSDRWPRIASLLEQALEMPPRERGRFLDRECGGDRDLRATLEDLLRADTEAGTFLDVPVDLSAVGFGPGEDAAAAVADAGNMTGAVIGSYKVVREIGRGGMGVVYEAEQQRPRRFVALKVILGGRYVDAATVRMFQREADSLARLKHPSIAAIYESGSTAEGQHFFAMELVQGRTLSACFDGRGAAASRSEVRDRLELFRQIASAVAYAHQRGVIHRDLKPSNILVVEAGAEAPAGIKILDFGLARIADPGSDAAATGTIRGGIHGTLPYMSPEQVRGRSDEVDVRTDVYALGVILYRLLSGRLPLDLEGADVTEAARIICEQAPRSLGDGVQGRLRFDRDLEVIVLKALEKDPARRYQTAAALVEDVGRYLSGQPILARPPSAAYQMRKLVARHRTAFSAAAAALLALVGVAILTTVQARRIATERDRANREAKTAIRVSSFLTDLFKVSDPDEAKGNSIKAREILDKGVDRIGKELADEPLVQAGLMLTMGNVYLDLGLYKEAEPLLEKSLSMRRRLLGEESLDTLASMDGLATLYVKQGRTAEAETLFKQTLERRIRLQGEGNPETLVTMEGLAAVYQREETSEKGGSVRKARYADEEAMRRRVLELRRRLDGEDDPATLRSASDLSRCLRLQRKYADAEAIIRPTLERQRRALGDDHPDTIGSMLELADTLGPEGRRDEAERLLREALDHMRRVFGVEHPKTLTAMNDLAYLFLQEKRFAEAEVLDREILAVRRRVLRDDHPDTLSSLGALADDVSYQRRYAEAETLLLEKLGRERRLLGEDHPHAVNTLYALASNSARAGHKAAALRWLTQAIDHGMPHAEYIAQDPDMASLNGDPAFESLIARAGKNPTH